MKLTDREYVKSVAALYNKPAYVVEVHCDDKQFPFALMEGQKPCEDSRTHPSPDNDSWAHFPFETLASAKSFATRIEKKVGNFQCRVFRTNVKVIFDLEIV